MTIKWIIIAYLYAIRDFGNCELDFFAFSIVDSILTSIYTIITKIFKNKP